jgi:hypothetical protein
VKPNLGFTLVFLYNFGIIISKGGFNMKLDKKRIQRLGISSIIFAIIYAIMLRFRVDMDLLVFIRLVSLFAVIFFAMTMVFDFVIQLVKKFILKK